MGYIPQGSTRRSWIETSGLWTTFLKAAQDGAEWRQAVYGLHSSRQHKTELNGDKQSMGYIPQSSTRRSWMETSSLWATFLKAAQDGAEWRQAVCWLHSSRQDKTELNGDKQSIDYILQNSTRRSWMETSSLWATFFKAAQDKAEWRQVVYGLHSSRQHKTELNRDKWSMDYIPQGSTRRSWMETSSLLTTFLKAAQDTAEWRQVGLLTTFLKVKVNNSNE